MCIRDRGEGGEGEGGEGEGGEGEGGDVHPVDIFKVYGISAPRSFSGVASPPGGEVDLCAVAAACPLLLAMTAALWLARVAVMAAFTRFIGTVTIFDATPDVIVAGVDGGEGEGDEGEGDEGEGDEGEGGEGEGGEGEGGEGEGGEGEGGEDEGGEGEGG